ncbi:MAG TPA: DUF6516 family protein [Dehalococcoidia bacterium]|nr:DUF6516 family protein [Dehalococcoidia bacterium]
MRDLVTYFENLRDILLSPDPLSDFLREPQISERDNQYGSLSLALSYLEGSQLYVELQADCEGEFPVWGDYGLQYLGPQHELRFRYDNAPHHRELPNFPYHLHLSDDEVLTDGPPPIRGVASAIRWHLDHPGRSWHPASL